MQQYCRRVLKIFRTILFMLKNCFVLNKLEILPINLSTKWMTFELHFGMNYSMIKYHTCFCCELMFQNQTCVWLSKMSGLQVNHEADDQAQTWSYAMEQDADNYQTWYNQLLNMTGRTRKGAWCFLGQKGNTWMYRLPPDWSASFPGLTTSTITYCLTIKPIWFY